MLNQATPVGKTAFDSVQAKQSAILAGYDVTAGGKYKEFLSKVTFDWKMKRQTPLVNAGYAARVQAISQSISSYVEFHKFRQSDSIQLVLLGCGADVVGLWSHSLDPQRVVVLEVDTPEICLSKSEILTRQELVTGKREDSGKLVGTIQSSSDRNNYFLCPVDLRDIVRLEAVVEEHLDVKVPTFVITELVLSYLSPRETDSLLRWCSSNLCSAPNSCFVALEPMGCAQGLNVLGPTEGYRRQYTDLFGGKMERGLSSKEDKIGGPSYFPLGTSCSDIRTRFQTLGYQAFVADLGTIATYATPPGQFNAPEIFDEHAALALYLKSYVVAIGFSPQSEGFMQRLVCPWQFETEIPPHISDSVGIAVIERGHEESVRNLVLQVYEENFEEYPVVKKMVSRMMNTDLAKSEGEEGEATIASRYADRGGIFLVAVQYNGANSERHVVGCVGVRRWGQNSKSATLEVVRLAVKASCRGKGIGRRLLQMVEKFAIENYEPPITLIAQTISILDEAKRLYDAMGYELEKESELGGNLSMLTYNKMLRST
ncbi:unnamed protein product [Cylindrotheca closterium]|uniref:[phosphatase 2A protein]-leucine-carboxy methyltransferase n=1 Tax=Cylindrotheca closterium TaxID=2856 RepID=A0AAD2GAY0_9STRA|nr:unnamed protein product [Cylindrotheca closterium]